MHKLLKMLMLAGWVMPLFAQTLDTGILGAVTDPAAAVVAGANITITNKATGLARTIKTTADGLYEARYLVPGEYTVEAQAAGFSTARTGVVLEINHQARVNFAMQIGDVQQT